MYAPYDPRTASAKDRVAWALCQTIDEDAPVGWTFYRGVAESIVYNDEFLADLEALKKELR